MTLFIYFVNSFFTSYPYHIYNYASSKGNFALTGVGLGLIQAQKIFWMANGIVFMFIISKNNNYILINNVLLLIICILYSISLYKCYSLHLFLI